MTTKEIQQDFFVTDDLTPYKGSWVAIRDGKVVDSALSPVELRDRAEVREDDVLIFVPSASTGAFVL